MTNTEIRIKTFLPDGTESGEMTMQIDNILSMSQFSFFLKLCRESDEKSGTQAIETIKSEIMARIAELKNLETGEYKTECAKKDGAKLEKKLLTVCPELKEGQRKLKTVAKNQLYFWLGKDRENNIMITAHLGDKYQLPGGYCAFIEKEQPHGISEKPKYRATEETSGMMIKKGSLKEVKEFLKLESTETALKNALESWRAKENAELIKNAKSGKIDRNEITIMTNDENDRTLIEMYLTDIYAKQAETAKAEPTENHLEESRKEESEPTTTAKGEFTMMKPKKKVSVKARKPVPHGLNTVPEGRKEDLKPVTMAKLQHDDGRVDTIATTVNGDTVCIMTEQTIDISGGIETTAQAVESPVETVETTAETTTETAEIKRFCKGTAYSANGLTFSCTGVKTGFIRILIDGENKPRIMSVYVKNDCEYIIYQHKTVTADDTMIQPGECPTDAPDSNAPETIPPQTETPSETPTEPKTGKEEKQKRNEKIQAEKVNGQDFILKCAAMFPINEGEPTVKIPFSECPAFYLWNDNYPDMALSLCAAEMILKHFDEKRHSVNVKEGHGGYYKTDFIINYNYQGESGTYEGRYDLGDNHGGMIAHMMLYAEWERTHSSDLETYGKIVGNPPETTDKLDFIKWLAGFLESSPETGTESAEIVMQTNADSTADTATTPTADGAQVQKQAITVTFSPELQQAAEKHSENYAECEQIMNDIDTAVSDLPPEDIAHILDTLPHDIAGVHLARRICTTYAKTDPQNAAMLLGAWILDFTNGNGAAQ